MIIVSDTTPIRYLVEIGEIHILASLFGGVIIPQKVFTELQGRHTPPQIKSWIQALPPWLNWNIRDWDNRRYSTRSVSDLMLPERVSEGNLRSLTLPVLYPCYLA